MSGNERCCSSTPCVNVPTNLCGPPVMINAVISLLESLGVDPENIRYDDFGA
jgi:Na+-transporting NADH:ubiquinone oxidoreductase subunit NqrF